MADDAGESATDASLLPTRARFVLSSPHSGSVLCAMWSGTGEYALSGGHDRAVHLWNAASGAHVKAYTGPHGREVRALALSPSGHSFASAGGDRGVFLWDVLGGECTRRLRGHEQLGVNALAYSDDGGLLASAGYDQVLRLWDVRAASREAVQSLTDARDAVTAVLFRDAAIYAASMDGCVRCYDVRQASRATDHIAVPVAALCLSADGQCLLLSCFDSTLRLLDCSSGQLLNEYHGAPARAFRMQPCFARDDALVVSGGEDGTIRAWDLVSGKEGARREGHSGAVTAVQWQPKDQGAMLSAGVDGTLRIWR